MDAKIQAATEANLFFFALILTHGIYTGGAGSSQSQLAPISLRREKAFRLILFGSFFTGPPDVQFSSLDAWKS
jgi:hypothetical protein